MNGVGHVRPCLICILGLLVANFASSVQDVMRREPDSLAQKSMEVGANGESVNLKGGPPIVIGAAELQEGTVRSVGVTTNDESGHPMVAHWHLQNLENNANTFEKTSGQAEYDAEALTEHGNVMSMKVRALQTDKAFRIGMTSNEFDHADFEHGFFLGFYDRGRLYVPDWTVSSYTPEDEFGLIVENGQMTLWKNDAKLHTFAGTVTGPMFAALYIHDIGAKAQITEMAISTDLGGGAQTVVLANQGPNGPAGESGPPGPAGVRGRHGDLGPPATIEMLYAPAPMGPAGPEGVKGVPGIEGERGPPGAGGGRGVDGMTGRMTKQATDQWVSVIEELDAGIKRAADMDREERQKLNARMNEVNRHLGVVELEVARQEALQKAALAAEEAEAKAASSAVAATHSTATSLSSVNKAGEQLESDAVAAKNAVILSIENNVGSGSGHDDWSVR